MIDVPCAQCGRSGPDLIRSRRRTVRYSCRSCGAVISARRADVLAGRGPWRRGTPAVAAREDDPLAAFLPAPMVRWVRATGTAPAGTAASGATASVGPAGRSAAGAPPDTGGPPPGEAPLTRAAPSGSQGSGAPPPDEAPDRRTLTRWYADFDRLAAQARDSVTVRARLERLAGVAPDALPLRPPPFPKVVGALNNGLFDPERAVARLVAEGFDAEPSAERVRLAHRWFATAGRPATWIAAEAAPEPEPGRVKALLEPGGLAEGLRGEQARAFFAALFGVPKGPSARSIVDLFSEARVRTALHRYLETGERPLRDAVLAALDAGAASGPGGPRAPSATARGGADAAGGGRS